MLRRNPQTGVWERKEGDQWVPTPTEASLDVALEDAFADFGALDNGSDGGDTAAASEESGPTAGVSTDVAGARDERAGDAGVGAGVDAPVDPAVTENGPAGSLGTLQVDLAAMAQDGPDSGPDSVQPGGVGGGAAGVDDWSIPGLVSTDTPRSTRGAQGLRKRLQERARGKRARATGAGTKERGLVKVEVGPRAARATGPAVKDSTEARQTRRRVPGAQGNEGAKSQRYVNRPAPGLLSGRPRWVQDLFEAHFRSEMTLGLRREHNRMKISRTDYAIGWLTLLDKIREEPSIARLRENGRD